MPMAIVAILMAPPLILTISIWDSVFLSVEQKQQRRLTSFTALRVIPVTLLLSLTLTMGNILAEFEISMTITYGLTGLKWDE